MSEDLMKDCRYQAILDYCLQEIQDDKEVATDQLNGLADDIIYTEILV